MKCVCALHNAGLLHRDIKPSNFGFAKRGSELLTQSISLFDVDTVCSVYRVPDGSARFSEGFAEPEARTMPANNLTDIFSIGATLFHAILVSQETQECDFLYSSAMYPHLRHLVDTSVLITSSETNSHPHLRALLTRILQKTLCPRRERYECCEDLLEDVQKALYYVIPSELADKGNPGQQWILADVDRLRELDSRPENHSTPALQYLLYTHPLYADCPAGKETLDVFVAGFGKYGQRFLDIVLQIAQMPGKRLRVTVVSASDEDKTVYLTERPELCRFFNVDSSLPDDPECYGEIRFVTHTLSGQAENAAFLHQVFAENGCCPDYAFVAAGRDPLTLSAAISLQTFCRTSFIWEGGELAPDEYGTMHPVYVNADMHRNPFFKELEQMAFNVHLLWNKSPHTPFAVLRKEFRKPYNHNSCTSFVIAMQYKLHGIGADAGTPAEQARQFLACISRDEALKRELICLEHRRWVTEKLCAGYRCITDLNECAGGSMKDERRKRHVCIVRSRPDAGLSSPAWTTPEGLPDPVKWDHPSPEALAALDELDRMSVELHLMHRRHADAEKAQQLFSGELVHALTGQTELDSRCAAAFRELLQCMKNLWHAQAGAIRRYDGLRHVCLSAVRDSAVFTEREKRALQRLLDSLHEHLYPVMASQMYQDYKQNDAALVEGISFILTHTVDVCVAVPYTSGDPSAVFSNLAASMLIQPSRLFCCAYCRNEHDLHELRQTFGQLAGYMKRREMRAAVTFLIGCPPGLPMDVAAALTSEWKASSEGRITHVRLLPAASLQAFAAALPSVLLARRRNTQVLLELNKTRLSHLLEAGGAAELLPCFRFDAAQMQFTLTHDCDALQYIHPEAFLTVSDLFPDAAPVGTPTEFMTDCRKLWKHCHASSTAWDALCRLLQTYASEHDEIAVFTRGRRTVSENLCRYLLPAGCRRSAEQVLCALKAQELIGSASRIRSVTSDCCAVEMTDNYGNRQRLDALFARPDLLMQTELICCRADPGSHTVRVLYRALVVKELDCRMMPEGSRKLLEYWHHAGLLGGLSFTGQTAHFTYATPAVREMLTPDGRLLSLAAYQTVKESGLFDDIRSREELGIRENAFDFVLTLGFTSLFVKCATASADYERARTGLADAAKQYGIRAGAVLVTETGKHISVLRSPSGAAEIERRLKELLHDDRNGLFQKERIH